MWRILWRIWGRLWIGFRGVSCRTGLLRGGRPLRGVCTLSRKDDLLWASRCSAEDVPDQREGPCALDPLDQIKRRANVCLRAGGPSGRTCQSMRGCDTSISVDYMNGGAENVWVDRRTEAAAERGAGVCRG